MVLGLFPAGMLTASAAEIGADQLDAEITLSQLEAEALDWDGAGTEDDPYLLGNQADLELLRTHVAATANYSRNLYFQLTNDIELDDTWMPIGVSGTGTAATNCAFQGTFDGGGNQITFAYGSKPLFGAVSADATSGAVIKNLDIYGEYIASNGLIDAFINATVGGSIVIENVNIKAGTTIKKSGFAGEVGSYVFLLDISNCTVEENVKIGWDADYECATVQSDDYTKGSYGVGPGVGSFVSGLCGIITNCKSSATVYGQDNVGGIVGYKAQSMRACTITNCTFDGKIIATGDYVGGIVGGGYGRGLQGFAAAPNALCVSIIGCIVKGSIQGNDNVGGIFGGEGAVVQAWSNGIGYIQNNYFAGTLEATGSNVGGIIGYMLSININNIIENNTYLENCGASKGVGGAKYIDTNHGNPTEISGVIYVDTSQGKPGISGMTRCAPNYSYYRTDDPLGVDAEKLASMYTVEQQNNGDISTAKAAVENANYTAAQAEVKNAEEAKAKVEDTIGGLSLNGVTAAVTDGTFTAATAGTISNIDGINGSYTFTVTLNKGNGTEQTYEGSLVITATPYTSPAVDTADITVTVAVEKLTVDGTYIAAPITLIIPAGYTAAQAVDTLLNALGIAYRSSGSLTGSGFYLMGIADSSESDGYLDEFDHGNVSGWMFCVNNVFPNVSAGVTVLQDGDVMRWQYTCVGIGSDITGQADKDALLKRVAEINTDGNQSDYGTAYTNALTILKDLESTQTQIDNALTALDLAGETVAEPVDYTGALENVLTYIRSQVQNPLVSSTGGEWAVLALLRGGRNDAAWNDLYLDALEQYIKTGAYSIDDETGKVVLHQSKITDNERVILALTSLGIDASSFRGYDLVSALLDKDSSGNYKLTVQGINGVIFALIALDSGSYLNNAEGQALRQWCIDYLLTHQKTTGGWSLDGTTDGTANPDITAMALQALAPYFKDNSSYEYAQVKTAVEEAVQALLDMQEADGSFSYGDEGKTSESAAQILVALTALGYDGTGDGSFLRSVAVNLLTYQDSATGGFRHTADGAMDQMASEQAAYALVAYDRYVKEQNTLYDMSGDTTLAAAFSDVKFSDWFYNLVTAATKMGLVYGYGNGTFLPNNGITRAEFLAILNNYSGDGLGTYSQTALETFSDMDQSWYTEVCGWAYATGVAAGYDDGTMRPNSTISRQEMSTMLYNYFKPTESFDDVRLKTFPDYSDVGDYARTPLSWATSVGIINGAAENGVNYIRPTYQSTRAMAATMMVNYLS